jgi:hypothetical protein
MTATVVRIVAGRRRRTPGAKARMFAGVERAKAEALAYLEASTATGAPGNEHGDWHALSKGGDSPTRLKLEAVVEFGVDLAGVVVVEAAEGDAVVEQDAVVAYVDCGDGG